MSAKKQLLFEEFLKTSFAMKRLVDPHSNMSLQDKVATMLQFQALSYLKENDGSTPGGLAKQLVLSSSSTAQLLERLIKSGWIKRAHDKTDKRIVHILLTTTGEKRLQELKDARCKKIERMIHYISEDDLETMVRILKQMIERIKDEK